MIIQGSPDILTVGPGLNNQFNGFGRAGLGATLTPEIAQDLMYRSSTTGVATSEFAEYGGYFAVKEAARAAGLDQTTESIQQYEIVNVLPESVSTMVNKQYIGDVGEALFAAQEAVLTGGDSALIQQVKQKIADDYEAAITAVEARNAIADQAAATAMANAVAVNDAAAAEFDRIQAATAAAVAAAYSEVQRAAVEAEAYKAQTLVALAASQAVQTANTAAAVAEAQRAAGEKAAAAALAAGLAFKAELINEQKKIQAEYAKSLQNQGSTGINPMLILAAVAAYFIVG